MVSSDCVDSSMDAIVDDTCKPINVESLREGSSDNPLLLNYAQVAAFCQQLSRQRVS